MLTGCSEESAGKQEEASKPDTGATQTVTEAEPPVVSVEVRPIALQKQFYEHYDWEEDTLLVQSEYSHVTLWQEDAVEYPQVAGVLAQSAEMIQGNMEDEFETLSAFMREIMTGSTDAAEPAVSALDIQVRRADSVAISLLEDSYSDYGRIEEFRGMHGVSYDTQTGQELKLTDVIVDMEAIPPLVEQELKSHMRAGEFHAATAVADYFRNTPEDGISWTLDYNGVTFYFGDGDLSEPGSGRQTATIAFAQHPDLFEEKYMTVPDAYMVELPLEHSFFTDLDGDGDPEELDVTGFYNSDVGIYTKFGVYTDTDGYYHYEECAADGFLPYYVKTAWGEHYLYLFCEEKEGAFPMFTLEVLDVSDGGFTRIGRIHAGPGYLPTDQYRVPTDPELFYLDDYDNMTQDMMPYSVEAMGLPQPQSRDAESEKADGTATVITVNSAEELLEAIGPDVTVVLESGYYNLSEYIEDVWAKEGEDWNRNHPYVQLQECFDGVEAVIRRADGLCIYGNDEHLTEIVTDPRHGRVMCFEECSDLSLFALTMGHTETGDCSGNVVDFYGCQNIMLSAMDIYGCGAFGIGCYEGTGELYVYNSTIRDCAYGALDIWDGTGRFDFYNCTLTGSDAYDQYEKTPDSELAFYGCVFGDNETSYYMFREDIYTQDCVWSENYSYPEYGYLDAS